jgi:DNA invertase Pin-like site-specific DNA recombinase
MTSERVTAVMVSRAEQGKWNGSRPSFGYKFDFEKQYPVPDEEESKILQMIYNK